jgi:PAS domain S-box-containing protein
MDTNPMELPLAQKHLRVLIVEDLPTDAELLVRELQRFGYQVSHQRVDSARALQEALKQPGWDVVLSDYAMPHFTGLKALELVKASGLDLPFILVSGTVGEDVAVEAMRAGAQDYLGKDRLARLAPAVTRELREAEVRRARRLSEDQVRQLSHAVHQAPVTIVITDIAGKIEYVNPKFTEITGYTMEEVRGQNPRILKTGETSAEEYQKLWAAISTGHEWRGVFHNRKKNGELFWESVSISAIRDAAGKITHYLAAKEDITERKRAEEKIREQAALLDQASDAIYVCDLEHNVLFWNSGAERLYGWPLAEVLHRDARKLFSQPVVPGEEVDALLLERGSWSGERHQANKAGEDIVVFSRLTLVRDERGQGRSVIAIDSDITEKKKLEALFLRAQRLESLGSLASGIAHDLNNVLAPILMAMPLLRGTVENELGQKLLATIEGSARRGADIVKQVLTFARGVQGERMPLQFRHVLNDMAEIAGETFPKNIRLETDVASDLWIIMGDATQLHQAVMNLCVNARDAMPEGGKLSIAAENTTLDEAFAQMTPGAAPGPYVRLRVADTGMGIAPEHLEKIFEPFFTTKAAGQGTGLGLATVLGITRSHGGFVRVKSEVGIGTSFELFLPATPTARERAESSEDEQLPRAEGELILLVDDEAAVRDVMRRVLEGYGYRVLTAVEGAEAVGLYVQHRGEVAVVITDMMMPGMDGPSLVRVLRHIEPAVRIVGISGVGERSSIKNLDALALAAYINKPFTRDRLLATLHEVRQTPAPIIGMVVSLPPGVVGGAPAHPPDRHA